MKKILLTTTESLHGWEIETYIKPVFANVVIGAGFLSDFNASITDFFGGRSNSYEKKLQSVNDSALNILKSKASELGANCILGLKVDMDQISGKNVQMFMVTAYGTAVIAKSIVTPKAISSSKEVDKSTIVDKATIIKLSNDIKSPSYQLSINGLQAIVDSKSSDFKEYILERLKSQLSSLPVDQSTYNEADKLFVEYFGSIEPTDAMEVLFSSLLIETHVPLLNKIMDIIAQFDLLDYDYSIKLLKSEALVQKKIALKLLRSDRPFYTIEDIDKMKETLAVLDSAFDIRASIGTKKGFLSSNEKEIWVCECSKSNSADVVYCPNCAKDKYGFKANDLKKESIMELLQNKIEALQIVLK